MGEGGVELDANQVEVENGKVFIRAKQSLLCCLLSGKGEDELAPNNNLYRMEKEE